jgi:hypothetical protein
MMAGEKRVRMVARFPESQAAAWLKIIAAAMIIPTILAGAAMLIALDRRVAVIESDRWTSRDQSAYADQEDIGVADLWRALGDRPLRVEVPPQWFIDQQLAAEARMIVRMDRLEALLRQHLDTHDGGDR